MEGTLTKLKPLPHEIKTFKPIIEYEGVSYLIESTVDFIKTAKGCKPRVEKCSVDEVL